MVDIITDEELASYLQVEVNPSITLMVEKTNELVTEAWTDAAAPAPTRVWAVAINVAARAVSNPKGLTSWTRSWDDISRTERVEGGALRKLGLYLTDEELLELNGEDEIPVGVGTIRTRTRDQVCPPPWMRSC